MSSIISPDEQDIDFPSAPKDNINYDNQRKDNTKQK